MQVFEKINKVISVITKIFMIICFSYMTIALSIQVFGRYIFNAGFSWTEESARYIMIWSVFIGAAYIALNLEHVKVSLIEDALKKASHREVLHIVQHVISLIFVVIVLCYGFMQLSIASLSRSANTGQSMLFPYMVFPVAFILLTYAYFYRLVKSILKMKNRQEGESEL
ncbi:MAG: TRAP transporter small permease [Eubacterium sp.]|jgi:TRAP-type C4-dicarboxylate transport system, small permease component|nr:TRAP transporter small permease [Eubacterium sp.]